jgi:hypothetical protein
MSMPIFSLTPARKETSPPQKTSKQGRSPASYHWVQGSPLPKEVWNPRWVPLSIRFLLPSPYRRFAPCRISNGARLFSRFSST